MSKLDATDIQGFVLRGYALLSPVTCFWKFSIQEWRGICDRAPWADHDRRTLGQGHQHQEKIKPESTVNIAFTHRGLVRLQLPDPSLLSFPVEFIQGMKARREILADTGKNDPAHWDGYGAKEKWISGWRSMEFQRDPGGPLRGTDG